MDILIDDRQGSKELLPYFRPYAVIVGLCHLDFADIAFSGNGKDQTLSIGIERKTINDLVQSMESGRLSDPQLRGLLKNYDLIYLVVEGIWRPGPGGELEISRMHQWSGTRRLTLYEAVDSYLTSIENCGVRVRRTSNERETAKVIVDLYHYWMKPWEDHGTHRDIYAPVHAESNTVKLVHPDPPNLAVKWACQIDGIDQRAWQVGRYFESANQLANASIGEWMEALGIRKSTRTAASVVDQIYRKNGRT
jgi:ERCC4-type nuclease